MNVNGHVMSLMLKIKAKRRLLGCFFPEVDAKELQKVCENFKERIIRRFEYRREKDYQNTKGDFSFEQLFCLPWWLPLELYIMIQMRGRPLSYYYKELSVDHLVALDRAKTFEELVALMSWKNSRLIPPDMNSVKASYWDTENKDLCFFLLNREHNGEDKKDPYQQQKDLESEDEVTRRFAKLMSRGKGKSQRAKINSADATKKKKDYRNKKRRK